MTTELNLFAREIRKIGESINPVHFYWYAEIKAGDKKFTPLRLLDIDIISDFENKFADEVFVEFLLGAGTFEFEIYPKKNDITVTLFRREIKENKEQIQAGRLIEKQEMRAVLTDTRSNVMASSDRKTESKETGDLNSVVQVRFQLINKALEQIRAKTVGGVFRASNGIETLKYLLTEVSKNIEVDTENEIKGVEVWDANNKEEQLQIIIPHGTPFVNVPEYIHQKCGGIYAADFGFYLFRDYWYVYPLFDLTRFDKDKKTLTILNVPSYKMPGRERTYRTTPNQVIVLSTGQTIQRDNVDIYQLNEGNGSRFTDARQMMSGFFSTEKNTVSALRGQNNHEFITDQRASGFNNVMTSGSRITSNPFVESSKIARRKGLRVACVWENSDPSLIFPGMAVRYQFLAKGQIRESKGVVLRADSHIHNPNPGTLNQWHMTNTMLLLFLEGNIDWFQGDGDVAQT